MLGLMVVAFIVLTSFSKRSQQKKQAEHERLLNEQLTPGVWVHTTIGFFGRFIDIDGNVVILETPSGEETYWDKRVIRSVGDLPFESEETVEHLEIEDGDGTEIDVDITEDESPAEPKPLDDFYDDEGTDRS